MLGKDSNLKLPDHDAELGYWIGVPYWGQGLIPEAAKELIRFGFEDLKLNKIWCGYFDGNIKSMRVQEKLGFKYQYTKENMPCAIEGEFHTVHVSCITKEVTMEISKEDMKSLIAAQQGELDAVLMYNALAKKVKDEKDAETFKQLAAEEGHHASVFKSLTNKVLKPKKTLAILVPFLYKLIGKKRLYPIIANSEYGADKNYAPLAEKFEIIQSVKSDEKRHGDTVMSLLEKKD